MGHDENGLVFPLAFVVAVGDDNPEELGPELNRHVRGELSPHKAPREVHFLEALPKTANGKVDRKALSESLTAP